jgi:hypothetical protein
MYVQERIRQLESDLDVRAAEAAELRRELFALDAERDRLQVFVCFLFVFLGCVHELLWNNVRCRTSWQSLPIR